MKKDRSTHFCSSNAFTSASHLPIHLLHACVFLKSQNTVFIQNKIRTRFDFTSKSLASARVAFDEFSLLLVSESLPWKGEAAVYHNG